MYKSSNLSRVHLKVLIVLVLIFLFGMFWFYFKSDNRFDRAKIQHLKYCYMHKGRIPNGTADVITYFEDILTSVKQPDIDNGVFFVSTNCSGNGIAGLKPR